MRESAPEFIRSNRAFLREVAKTPAPPAPAGVRSSARGTRSVAADHRRGPPTRSKSSSDRPDRIQLGQGWCSASRTGCAATRRVAGGILPVLAGSRGWVKVLLAPAIRRTDGKRSSTERALHRSWQGARRAAEKGIAYEHVPLVPIGVSAESSTAQSACSGRSVLPGGRLPLHRSSAILPISGAKQPSTPLHSSALQGSGRHPPRALVRRGYADTKIHRITSVSSSTLCAGCEVLKAAATRPLIAKAARRRPRWSTIRGRRSPTARFSRAAASASRPRHRELLRDLAHVGEQPDAARWPRLVDYIARINGRHRQGAHRGPSRARCELLMKRSARRARTRAGDRGARSIGATSATELRWSSHRRRHMISGSARKSAAQHRPRRGRVDR